MGTRLMWIVVNAHDMMQHVHCEELCLGSFGPLHWIMSTEDGTD